MSTFDHQTARLRDLCDRYVERVNGALRSGDDVRAQALSEEYVDEALRLILDDAVREGTVPAGRLRTPAPRPSFTARLRSSLVVGLDTLGDVLHDRPAPRG